MSQILEIEAEYTVKSQSATSNLDYNIEQVIPILVKMSQLTIIKNESEHKDQLEKFLKISYTDQEVIGHVNELDFEFELDINKMKTNEKYIFDYYDSKYMAIKNDDGNIELSEISIDE